MTENPSNQSPSNGKDKGEGVEAGGFNKPRSAQDSWTTDLYEKHRLGQSPSLEQVEEKATMLLSDPTTALEGAELVLGRRIDGREKDIAEIFHAPGLSGKKKFGLLLMQIEIEKSSFPSS